MPVRHYRCTYKVIVHERPTDVKLHYSIYILFPPLKNALTGDSTAMYESLKLKSIPVERSPASPLLWVPSPAFICSTISAWLSEPSILMVCSVELVSAIEVVIAAGDADPSDVRDPTRLEGGVSNIVTGRTMLDLVAVMMSASIAGT